MKLVLILWHDAQEHAGWYSDAEIGNFHSPQVRTVGWLFSMDDKNVRVVTSRSDDGSGGVNVIPAAMVKQIFEIEEPK